MKERGSWTWVIEQLHSCQNWLSLDHEYAPEELPLVVRNLDPAESAAVEAAVCWLANTNGWPELSDSVSRQLDLRLDHAIHVCASMRAARSPAPTETFSDLFRWAMLDCWDAHAERWADDVAQKALRRSRRPPS